MHIIMGILLVLYWLLKIQWWFISPEDKNEIEMENARESVRRRKQRNGMK